MLPSSWTGKSDCFRFRVCVAFEFPKNTVVWMSQKNTRCYSWSIKMENFFFIVVYWVSHVIYYVGSSSPIETHWIGRYSISSTYICQRLFWFNVLYISGTACIIHFKHKISFHNMLWKYTQTVRWFKLIQKSLQYGLLKCMLSHQIYNPGIHLSPESIHRHP